MVFWLNVKLARFFPRFASTEALYVRHIRLTGEIQGLKFHERFKVVELMEILRQRSLIDRELKRRGS